MPKASWWQPGFLETLSMVLAIFLLTIMERTQIGFDGKRRL